MAPSIEWTTQVPRKIMRSFPSDDVHAALFLPPDWFSGCGRTVSLLYPWQILLGPDNELVRPPPNSRAVDWLCVVCDEVNQQKHAVFFICTTPEQVDVLADAATILLPDHTRIPLERVYAGAVGPLN